VGAQVSEMMWSPRRVRDGTRGIFRSGGRCMRSGKIDITATHRPFAATDLRPVASLSPAFHIVSMVKSRRHAAAKSASPRPTSDQSPGRAEYPWPNPS